MSYCTTQKSIFNIMLKKKKQMESNMKRIYNICISLCIPETNTTLYISYIPIIIFKVFLQVLVEV